MHNALCKNFSLIIKNRKGFNLWVDLYNLYSKRVRMLKIYNFAVLEFIHNEKFIFFYISKIIKFIFYFKQRSELTKKTSYNISFKNLHNFTWEKWGLYIKLLELLTNGGLIFYKYVRFLYLS